MKASSFRRPRWRRPAMPKFVEFKAIPKMLWVILSSGYIAYLFAKPAWGTSRGIGVGVLVVVVCYAPRYFRVQWMTSSAFYYADDVLKIDQWEARRSNRWRSSIQKVGFARDFSFWGGQQSTAARKGKYVKLRLHPWFSLWPVGTHIKAVSVRIPPPRRLGDVKEDLRKAMAEFFDVPPSQVRDRVKRAMMRTWVTFWISGGGGRQPPPDDFIGVLDRTAGRR